MANKREVTRWGLGPGVQLMLGAVFFFALMNVGVKWLSRIPFYEVVFVRSLVTLVLCLTQLRLKGLRPWGSHHTPLVLRGLFGSLALLCYFYTLQTIPLATASTMHFLSPIWSALLASFLMKERVKGFQWVGILLAFSGVLLLRGFDTRIGGWEMLIALGGALFSGSAYNMISLLRGKEQPLVIVLYFPLVTLPLITPYVLTHWVWPTALEWALLLGVGVVVQVAQLLMTRAYHLEPVARVAPINYTGLLYALGFGYLLFGETFSWGALLAMGVIVLGLWINLQQPRSFNLGELFGSWGRRLQHFFTCR